MTGKEEQVLNSPKLYKKSQAINQVAQDYEPLVKKYISEFILLGKDLWKSSSFEEHDGIKGVAYGNMMGLVFEAIKELDDKLEEIKKQLNK
jgi:uncharacterized protein YaaR (DUF327 family)